MTLLQFFLIFISIVFILFAIDAFQRKRLNLLHFLVFFGGTTLIILFSLNNDLLNKFGNFFGVARGADLLVYIGIVLLAYFYFELLHKVTRNKETNILLNRKISLFYSKGSLNNKNIVFVIPAYNEGEEAEKVINNILNNGHGVVFVDDGSKNNLFEKLQNKYQDKSIVFIKHLINFGQGAALQTGFDYIKNYGDKNIEYVVTFDSDGQHRLEDLDNFLKVFRNNKNIDIVLGSRFLGKAKNIPFSKKIVLKLGIIITWIISGIKLTDTHNGYRVIKKDSLNKINITMNGMEHASEIIDIIKNKGLIYKEVPITVLYTNYSIKKGQKISNAIKILLELIYKKFFFK